MNDGKSGIVSNDLPVARNGQCILDAFLLFQVSIGRDFPDAD